MADVLLIQPPVKDFYLTVKRTMPYGLACIAATLLDAGLSVQLLDCLATDRSQVIALPPELAYLQAYYGLPDTSPFALFHQFRYFGCSLQHIEHQAKRSQAWLVGISCLFTAYSREALEVAKIVRKSLPHCRIVLGGHHPTAMPEQVLECAEIDYVIRGEGEAAMVQLAKAIRDAKDTASIRGVMHRRADGTVSVGSPAVVEDLNALPPPALHLVKHRFYRRKSRGSAVVCGSRGCPLQCSYCSLGGPSAIPYRRRTVESVLQEIGLAVVEHTAGFIDFEDENISLEKRWFLELLHGIRERFGGFGLELRAMNGLFPASLDDEVIGAMAAAGFKMLNLSLGATLPEQLRRFGRPDVTAAFEAALESAERHRLQAVGYIIVAAPGQDPHDSLQDLLFLAARRVLAGVSVFYPAPGSRDFSTCERLGILPTSFGLMRGTALPVADRTSREDAVTLLRLARLLNFMKSIIDSGRDVPRPAAIGTADAGLVKDRMEKGKILLQAFLEDAVIRGVTPDGAVFEHRTNRALCARFRSSLRTMKVRGARL